MLFDSSAYKECTRSFGATLVILLTIVLTMLLIKVLGQAANGLVSPSHIILFLGYTLLGYLPLILTLSLFVATVGALSRMYRDSEMNVWFASGVALSRFLRPVFRLAGPVIAVVAVLALWGWPWANEKNVALKILFAQQSDLSKIAPGQFQTSKDGKKVFFIENNTDGGKTGKNVFVLNRKDQTESVTSAQTGYIDNRGDVKTLILENGQQVEFNNQTQEKRMAHFDRYRITLSDDSQIQQEILPPKAQSSLKLLQSGQPNELGELIWRIGLPLTAINLVILGLGLSVTNPRRGTSSNTLMALLAFIVYYNLLNLSQAWVSSGKLPAIVALLGIHGLGTLGSLMLLCFRQEKSLNLFKLFQKQSTLTRKNLSSQ